MNYMRSIKVLFFLFILFVFVRCATEFEKGENEFQSGRYEEAKGYFLSIDKSDPSYESARSQLLRIDSLLGRKEFYRADSFYKAHQYSDAEKYFLKVNKSSDVYDSALLFLLRIDSIRQARILENEDRKKKNVQEQRLADAEALARIKKEVKMLFEELLVFKDKADFRTYGFGVGYKYHRWLEEVDSLKDVPEAKLLLGKGFVVGDLMMLGHEYVGSEGKETEYSRWAKKAIGNGLKK